MTTTILKRDITFYALIFMGWASIIYLVYQPVRFKGTAPPSLINNPMAPSIIFNPEKLRESINNLRKDYKDEENFKEKIYMLHNTGIAYYDLFKSSGNREYLDSARYFFSGSVEAMSDNAKFSYNLARVFTEMRNHDKAKKYYKQTLKLDSTHIFALHNLALTYFNNDGETQKAITLLNKSLEIDPGIYMANYVLGLIYESRGEYKKSVNHYKKELECYQNYLNKRKNTVPDSHPVLAACGAHQNLGLYYSRQEKNREKMIYHLRAFLSLEHDRLAANEYIKTLRRYWPGLRVTIN